MIELIAFGKRWWRELLIVILVAFVAGEIARWKASIAREAIAAHDLRAADSTLAILRPKYSADSAKLARDSSAADSAIAHWQTVATAASNTPEFIHVPGRVDTLTQHDTTHWIDTVARQPTRAEILQAGDDLAHACRELQNDCARSKADLLARVAALQRENTSLRALEVPPRRSCIAIGALAGLAGFVGGAAIDHYAERRVAPAGVERNRLVVLGRMPLP